ncbi:ABC transporter substrate-binding protein [Leucobacter sp. CSA1]|uniref:ABC transporter substrate-binding protein n=1 Tax=Leucobacter chromiisoli TaxID=2796471 RepID=A0A934Q9J1_9MICO|nr:ABC transporter substrate-binding protein [Leucobacter chromiisoli]MBK0420013.1 ABC transporter substrate-binding protein [Leucobacter chromiisoli]
MTNIRFRRATTAVAAAAALALSACSGQPGEQAPSADGGAGEPQTLQVAATGVVSDGSLLTGVEEGFFEDEGLQVETSIVANPAAGLAAVQSGQVDVAFAPSVPVMNALSGGVPLTIVAAADGYVDGASEAEDPSVYDDSGLYASRASGITDVSQLEGRTVAVPARKAMFEVAIADELSRAGVDPDSVEWVTLDFASTVSALESGKVDAASVVTPFTVEAEQVGAVRIASAAVGLFEEGAVGLWVTGDSVAKDRAEAIEAFQRAIVRSNEFANENNDVAVAAGLEFSGSDLDVADVKSPYWPTELRRADLDRINEKLVRLGFLEQGVDLDGKILGDGSR